MFQSSCPRCAVLCLGFVSDVVFIYVSLAPVLLRWSSEFKARLATFHFPRAAVRAESTRSARISGKFSLVFPCLLSSRALLFAAGCSSIFCKSRLTCLGNLVRFRQAFQKYNQKLHHSMIVPSSIPTLPCYPRAVVNTWCTCCTALPYCSCSDYCHKGPK